MLTVFTVISHLQNVDPTVWKVQCWGLFEFAFVPFTGKGVKGTAA